MIRARHSTAAHRRMAGLSLIEMMVALVMALIVAAGIISVFTSTSSSNKVQAQMATLQEEGRFAIYSLRSDLANANSGYCSNTGGNAGVTASGLYLDALRSPTVYAKNVTFPDNTVTTLPTPTQAYSLPSSLFMRGYDCTATACTPLGLAGLAPGIPAMGTAAGNRVMGADVLTIRYLKPGSGWAIAPGGSTINAAGGSVNTITLGQLPGEQPTAAFTGSLAMLADCSNAQVFAVSNAGGTLTPQNNFAQPLNITNGSAPRVFDFTNDFQTVTYYLQVVGAGNGRTTGELMRRVNGGIPQPLVRGVERLDFRYGIIDANGKTQFLTADQVDKDKDASGNSIPCPPGVPIDGGMGDGGCLWRAVQTIEVHILMDGQTPLYTLTPAEMNYTYTPDCVAVPASCAATTIIKPTAHVIQPNATQGFPTQLLRREFTTLVALRNFNP